MDTILVPKPEYELINNLRAALLARDKALDIVNQQMKEATETGHLTMYADLQGWQNYRKACEQVLAAESAWVKYFKATYPQLF